MHKRLQGATAQGVVPVDHRPWHVLYTSCLVSEAKHGVQAESPALASASHRDRQAALAPGRAVTGGTRAGGQQTTHKSRHTVPSCTFVLTTYHVPNTHSCAPHLHKHKPRCGRSLRSSWRCASRVSRRAIVNCFKAMDRADVPLTCGLEGSPMLGVARGRAAPQGMM